MSAAAASELLSFQVIQGEQVVTYRKLSNELQIHINEAKRLMASFYDDHKDRCHATFALTGAKKREMSNDSLASELLVALVKESELSTLTNDLENAEYHVYSLEPRILEDRNALVAANISSGNMRDSAELGAVRSSVSLLTKSTTVNDYNREPEPKIPAAAAAAAVNQEIEPRQSKNEDQQAVDEDVAMDETKTLDIKKAAPATTNKNDSKSKDTSSGATSSAPTKAKSMKSFFGKNISKKPASSAESSVKPDRDNDIFKQEAEKETNQKPEQEKEKGQADSQEQVPESEDMEMQSTEEVEPPTKRQRVEDMFDDDDFVNDFKSSSTILTRDNKSNAETKAMDDSQQSMASAAETQSDVEMAEPMVSASEDDHDGNEKGRRRVRKLRKVNKIKHTKNKRGMLVTQTVEDWESYFESESDSEPAKPKSVPGKQSAASAEAYDQNKTSSKGKSKSSA
ncbi:CDC27 protein, partial [Coemansia erecta]